MGRDPSTGLAGVERALQAFMRFLRILKVE